MDYLRDYWDELMCILLHYGFPLDFNVKSPLKHEITKYSLAIQYKEEVKAYLDIEKEFNAIFAPFKDPPLENMHFNQFFVREKPGTNKEE